MHEYAFVSNFSDSGWVPIVLLDISSNGISLACSEVLQGGNVHAFRFTLPGTPKLHFASGVLLPATTGGVLSGYRYGARFSSVDRNTIDHIVTFLSEPV
jgi:hypothetical protein